MNKNETITDIAAEKRERAQAIRQSLSTVPDRRDAQIAEAEELESDADRIEAAWERETEIAYLNGQMDEIMNAVNKLETWRGALWCKLSRLHNEMQEGERK